MPNAGALALLLFSMFLTTRAYASEIEDFQTARHAYDARDYLGAVHGFESLLGPPIGLRSPELILEARKYLGAAYVMVGRRDAAQEEFRRLLSVEPGYEIDPRQFPLEVVEMFTSVQRELRRQLSAEQAQHRLTVQHDADQARIAALIAFAEEESVTEQANSRALASVPFGVGQFQNGNEELAWIFLISESLTLGAGLFSLAWHQMLVDQLAGPTFRGAEDLMQGNRLLEQTFVANWISMGLFVVVALVGILEAQVNFVPHTTLRQRRVVPDALRSNSQARIDAALLEIF